MSGGRLKHKRAEKVKLNRAARLEVVCHLLPFFILTFKPAPVEGQITLRMPPPMPVTASQDSRKPGDDPDRKSVVKGKSVDLGGRRIIKKNNIGSMAIGDVTVGNISRLNHDLK